MRALELQEPDPEYLTRPKSDLGEKAQVPRVPDHARAHLRLLPDMKLRKLYSTCASPVVPHPSTGHAHGCLASEIGRDPAFPTRFDRTVASPEVSLLAPSRLGRDCGKRDDFSKENIIKRNMIKKKRGCEAMRYCTHHRSYNQGLISADRSNKATLLLTIPRCLLSRLQRISRAQCSKLLFANQLHGFAAGSMQLIRYRPKLSIHA
jgi:hypothetical protein